MFLRFNVWKQTDVVVPHLVVLPLHFRAIRRLRFPLHGLASTVSFTLNRIAKTRFGVSNFAVDPIQDFENTQDCFKFHRRPYTVLRKSARVFQISLSILYSFAKKRFCVSCTLYTFAK